MKDEDKHLREIAQPYSVAWQGISAWRSQHRKKMVDSIQRLIEMAEKNATSQYTRSNQRARWTRLCGQLIWYKDQILRAMTFEALEQDSKRLAKKVLESKEEQRRMALRPITPQYSRINVGLPAELKKAVEDKDSGEDKESDGWGDLLESVEPLVPEKAVESEKSQESKQSDSSRKSEQSGTANKENG